MVLAVEPGAGRLLVRPVVWEGVREDMRLSEAGGWDLESEGVLCGSTTLWCEVLLRDGTGLWEVEISCVRNWRSRSWWSSDGRFSPFVTARMELTGWKGEEVTMEESGWRSERSF
jgi:hypothetical protein